MAQDDEDRIDVGPWRPVLFPAGATDGTALVLSPAGAHLPLTRWLGPAGSLAPAGQALSPHTAEAVDAAAGERGVPLLSEHSRGWYTRPALRGHRLGDGISTPAAGRDWSTALRPTAVSVTDDRLRIDAADEAAGLGLRTTVERLAGGALRARHQLTNTGQGDFVVDGLEVLFPLPDHLTEILDFTGQALSERVPQRRELTDGLWLREQRRGRTGHDAATMAAVGSPGFGTTEGEVVAVHVAWSGNSVLRVERDAATTPSIGGGELLLPGEMVLAPGESYATPWVFVVACDDGLDGVAAGFHGWLRSLAAHPRRQPVTLNVWEAVYFDHRLPRLSQLAELAASVGVERYVLDDGWFRHRRHDRAGLGDWWVDPDVWPDGLRPLSDRVHELGMQFGLWFEPEMVNPDSDLYRAHPDWILSAGGRTPTLQRNQLVLDLTRHEVVSYLLERMDAELEAASVDYVKWDHNRELLESGRGARDGIPGVHAQTEAFYRLIDELRARHPQVEWESCASGGARVDLGVLSRVQRVWTSDMTDALARQHIQRWSAQLVPPEYLGAHVSAPSSHQTGRTLPLDFRAGTALFGAFGIEWDLTAASADDLARLAEWVALFKRFRPLLHGGRVIRPESADPFVLLHGVVAGDRTEALVAVVQLDHATHSRGLVVRVPGLDPTRDYRLAWVGPGAPTDEPGPLGDVAASGAVLAITGFWVGGRRPQPETVRLVHVTAAT